MKAAEGKQVYLRPITKEDTMHIVSWRNSEEVRPYFVYQKPFTKESHEAWLENMIFSGKGYQFIVCDKETDEPVGSTYLRDYDKENNVAEFGIFLSGNKVKGKGIGKEATWLTLKYAFETVGMHKVFCRIFSDNIASQKALFGAGFVKEAYFKDMVKINGEYRDMVFGGLLETEWKENNDGK